MAPDSEIEVPLLITSTTQGEPISIFDICLFHIYNEALPEGAPAGKKRGKKAREQED